ncbi:MAG: hypothetical protein GXO79_12780 [Chlorobi bacterium]|nr:hypothetical protein [Chlorobiota bacterium]
MANNFNIEIAKSKSLISIQMEGNLTLNSAEKIKEKLKSIKIGENHLKGEIIIANIVDIDLSFLQLLISFSKNQKTVLPISMNLTEEQKSLVKSSGILDLLQIKLINN